MSGDAVFVTTLHGERGDGFRYPGVVKTMKEAGGWQSTNGTRAASLRSGYIWIDSVACSVPFRKKPTAGGSRRGLGNTSRFFHATRASSAGALHGRFALTGPTLSGVLGTM